MSVSSYGLRVNLQRMTNCPPPPSLSLSPIPPQYSSQPPRCDGVFYSLPSTHMIQWRYLDRAQWLC